MDYIFSNTNSNNEPDSEEIVFSFLTTHWIADDEELADEDDYSENDYE